MISDETMARKLKNLEADIRATIIEIRIQKTKLGRLLWEAKQLVAHGNFQNWISETFGSKLAVSTAQAYLRVYKVVKDLYESHNGKIEEALEDFPITFLMVACAKEFPQEARDIVFGHAPAEVHDLKHGFRYKSAIKHADLSVVTDAFKKYKRGDMSEQEFVALVRQQHEQGKQAVDGKVEAAEAQARQTQVDKLETWFRTISTTAGRCSKFYRNIQGVNPLVEDQRKYFLGRIDHAMEVLVKVREDITQQVGKL